MTRDIKFKAKSVLTGEWVFGYLVEHSIYSDGQFIQIDPDTVCEYTGLDTPIRARGYDKQGNYAEYQEIYEHDILTYNQGATILNGGYCFGVVTNPGDKFIVRWTKTGFVLVPLSKFDKDKLDYFNKNGIIPNTGFIIPSYDTWNNHTFFEVSGNEFDEK